MVPSCQCLFLKQVEEDADSKEKDQSPKPKEKETKRPSDPRIVAFAVGHMAMGSKTIGKL